MNENQKRKNFDMTKGINPKKGGGWKVPTAFSKARHFACDEVGCV